MPKLDLFCTCVLPILVGILHVKADMMKILEPQPDATLYVGSQINLTISITADAPACATAWSLWITGENQNGQTITSRVYKIFRNDYPNSPLEQTVLTDRIPGMFQPPVSNVTMYLQCSEAQTYPATSYVMHGAIEPYAELVVPEGGYWYSDPSAVFKWNVYGPSTTWSLWRDAHDGAGWRRYCLTTSDTCTHALDGYFMYMKIMNAETGVVVQQLQLPALKWPTFNLHVPNPAIMYPASNFTISWDTTGPISYINWLMYAVNSGLPTDVSPNTAISNTGSYLWTIPNTIQMGDQVSIQMCCDQTNQSCQQYTVMVIKPLMGMTISHEGNQQRG